MFASTVNLLAALAGLVTTAIVLGGFLAHAYPAISGESEVELRRVTAEGGLFGLAVAILGLSGLGMLT